MYIYRNVGDGEKRHIRKISTVRVTQVSPDSCQLFTIAGGIARGKGNDWAVLHNDTRNNHSLYGLMDNDAYTINYMYDKAYNMSTFGTTSHLLLHVGFGAFKNYKDYKYAITMPEKYNGNTYLYNAPMILQLSAGYGYSFQLVHRLQIMPYVMVQAENLVMTKSDTEFDQSAGYDMNGKEKQVNPIWGPSVRCPLGVKVNINVAYPFQIFAGGEINFFKFGIKNSKDDAVNYETIDKNYLKPSGYKRTGVSLYAGFRFCL